MKLDEKWSKMLGTTELKVGWELRRFIEKERKIHTILPNDEDVFNALNLVPPEKVKVVIIGQDPYHGEGQAHGLCFSVKNNQPPPSLINIFKEIETDTGKPSQCQNGDLSPWANQGVLLLNTVLTVKSGMPNSHKGKGWEQITKRLLSGLCENYSGIVYILWGANAKSFEPLIDKSKNLVLSSVHPSPLSAYSGFFGSKPFSKCNNYLKTQNKCDIIW